MDKTKRGTVTIGGEEFESPWWTMARKTRTNTALAPLVNKQGRTSTWMTSTAFITTIVGASILGFPKLFEIGGWYVSPVIMLSVYWASIEIGYAMEYTLKYIVTRIERGETFSFSTPENYSDLAEGVFGQWGKTIGLVSININALGLCGAFMILIGQCVEYLVGRAFWSPYRACVIAVSLLFLPLTMLDDISMIAKLSVIGAIAGVVYAVSIGTAGFQAAASYTEQEYRYLPAQITDIGQVIAVMWLGFTYQQVVPTLRSEMRTPTELPKAVNGALTVVLAIYGSCGVIAYYGWGGGENGVHGNILRSMRTGVGTPEESRMAAGFFLAAAVSANLFVTFPLFMSCVTRSVEASTTGKYSPVVRVSLLLFVFCIALFLPYFLEFLGLLGAVSGTMVGAFLPVACYWGAAKHDDSENKPGVFTMIRHAGIILLGLFALVFGSYTAIQDIVSAITAPGKGFWESFWDYSY